MSFAGLGILVGILIFLIRNALRGQTGNAAKPAGSAARGTSSARFGYSFDLPRKGWQHWPELTGQLSGGVARKFGNEGGLLLIPALLDDAPLNNETLAAAFLSAAGGTLKDANNGTRRAINLGGLAGTQFDFRTVRNGNDELWRARVLRGQRFAYFIAAFVDKKAESKIETAAGPLETLKIEEPAKVPDLTEGEKRFQRFFFNDSGIHAMHQGDYANALHLFRRSLTLGNDPVVLSNLCAAAERGGLQQIGYDEIQKAAPNRAGTPELLGYQARFEQQLGHLEASEETYRALFQGGFDDDDAFRDFAGLLWRREKKEEAYSLARARAERLKSAPARLLVASMEAESDPDQALATIELVLKEDPHHLRALIQKTETYADSGRYSEALAQTRALLDQGYEYPYIYFLKGRAELGLSLLREAQESLETARKGMPNDEGVVALQERVAGLLGQGNRAMLKEPIEPEPLPEKLAQVFLADPPSFDPGVHQAYYPLVSRVHSFKKNERFKTTDYSYLAVTGPEGARMYTVFQFPVDPLSERVYVNELSVKTPDGKVVQGDQESYFVMDDSSRGMSSHKQILHIPVPGVVPGALVRLVLTRQLLGISTELPYRIETLSCRVPALMSTVSLKGDLAETTIEVPPESELLEREEDRITWVLREPEPAVAEPFCPPYLETLPLYRIGPRASSWPEAASEYALRVIRDIESQEVKELASRIAGAASNNEERLLQVVRFLQSEIRYIAIEFGSRGIEPASPQDTISRKYGDCKDQAVLGTALLRSLGVKAWPALVSTESAVAENMPSLDQFNHMVIYADIDGGRFADPTQRYQDPRLVVPAGLGGRTALVLTENPQLVKIPAYPADSSSVVVERMVQREGDMLTADESVTLSGYFGGSMRGFLSGVNSEVHAMVLQDLFVSSGVPLRLKSVQVQDLADPSLPLRLRCNFERPHGFISGANPAVLPFVSWESYLIEVRANAARRHPFELPYPTIISARSQYGIPGAHAETTSGQNDYAKFSMSVEPSGNSFSIRYECRTNAVRGGPANFAAVSAMSLEATAGLHKPLVL